MSMVMMRVLWALCLVFVLSGVGQVAADGEMPKTCDDGDERVCFKEGFNLMMKDPEAAAALLGRGCELNHAASCQALAGMYWAGMGLSKDLTKAHTFYEKGCVLGDDMSCGRWMDGHCKIDLGESDINKCVATLETRCNAQDTSGCYILGLFYSDGEPLPADPKKAETLFSTGCDGTDGRCCSRLASLYYDQNDFEKSNLYREKACAKGFTKDCPPDR